MPRPQKKGLDYFPLDVDFFHNRKMRILKAKFGLSGISIYLYLLCEIYKNGYYLQMDEDFMFVVADDLGMSINKIRQVLNFLLERSLFDSKLFQSDKVLTSAGIQKRFQLAVKERAKKNPIEVGDFWILQKSETESFIKVLPFLNNSENNGNNSGKNANKSQEESLKESKVNKNKVKERSAPISHEEKEALIQEYGQSLVKEYIERTTQYHCCNYATIKKWIEEDKTKKRPRKGSNFSNFTQRDYTDEDFERIEEELTRNNQ